MSTIGLNTAPYGGGYVCQGCGQWVTSGIAHFCWSQVDRIQDLTAQLSRIEAQLGLVAAATEMLVRRLSDVIARLDADGPSSLVDE